MCGNTLDNRNTSEGASETLGILIASGDVEVVYGRLRLSEHVECKEVDDRVLSCTDLALVGERGRCNDNKHGKNA